MNVQADVHTVYLLSCLLPDELLTDSLILSPPLDELDAATHAVPLQLFKKMAIVCPPPAAYSRYAPIGTGRPRSHLLLAESDKKPKSAADARRSLAYALLSNRRMVRDTIDTYNVLAALYRAPTPMLHGFYRSLLLMSSISNVEWIQRLSQLRGIVHGHYAVKGVTVSCDVEPRLEIYLLQVGRGAIEGWIRDVVVASELGEKDRSIWAEVYADAARFLVRAVGEMFD